MGLDLDNNKAGRDLNVTHIENYMVLRGPKVHRAFLGGPEGTWADGILGSETVENLRAKLVVEHVELHKPQPIRVTGSLFPCALLSSGWWDKAGKTSLQRIQWRDEIQQWLFHGFDQWGPSWDFTWDFEHWENSKSRPYFIAQIGDGDEANSIPVLIPGSKARRLQEYIDTKGKWAGLEAEVVGVLGHRHHFEKYLDPHAIELFGGLLDYCLWMDEDNAEHGIRPQLGGTDVYSGYIWRCVAPEALAKDQVPSLRDVYFIWEHTNFASKDAVAYNLDALERKQAFIEKRIGKLTLVQKSSSLVPGDPAWSQREIYNLLVTKTDSKMI